MEAEEGAVTINKKFILLVLLSVLLLVPTVLGTVVTVTSGATNSSFIDTQIDAVNAANNFGLDQTLVVEKNAGAANSMNLYGFDLEAIIGSGNTINNISIIIYNTRILGNGNFAFWLLKTNFSEGGQTGAAPDYANWSRPNASVDTVWTSGTGDQDELLSAHIHDETSNRLGNHSWGGGADNPHNQWWTWEITNTLIQTEYENNGWIYLALNASANAGDNGIILNSKESANPWTLYIDYDTDTPPTVTWDNETPASGSTYNFSSLPNPLQFYFLGDDTGAGNIDCHLSDGTTFYDSIYNVPKNTNQSLNVSSFATDGNYSMRIDCDDGTTNTTSTIKYIVYDTIPPDIPLIGQAFPLEDNSSIAYNSRNVPLNVSCGDVNELWSFGLNLTFNNGTLWNFFIEDLNVTNYTYDTPQDFGMFPNGTVLTHVTCWDSHTAVEIPDYLTDVQPGVGQLSYNTGDNLITVYTLDELDGLSTSKHKDRYDFEFEFTEHKDKYYFYLYAEKPLVYQKNSGFAAHFISGTNWIDFEIPTDPTASYKIKQINEQVYEIEVKTYLKKIKFNSIGGLNRADTDAQFRIGDTAPTNDTTFIPSNNTYTANYTINLNCTGSTDADGDTIYHDYFTGTSPGSLTLLCNNVLGDCAWNDTTTINGWNFWQCQANDTFFSSDKSEVFGILSDTTDIIYLNESINAETGYFTEGEKIYFSMNVSYNEIRYKDSTATFNFTNQSFTLTKVQYDNYTNYYGTTTLPNVDVQTTFGYTWIVNLTYHNDSVYSNGTYDGSITVDTIVVNDNCTATNASDAMTFNISFWDEHLMEEYDFWYNDSFNSTARVNFDYSISFYKSNQAINTTIQDSLTNITSFGMCIPINEEYRAEAEFEYWRAGMDHRHRYFVNKKFNNFTQQLRYFLLDKYSGSFEEGANPITPSVEDCDGNPLTGYFEYYKYDYINSTPYIMDMGQSDAERDSTLYLQKGYTEYQVKFRNLAGLYINLENTDHYQTINSDTPQYFESCDVVEWKQFGTIQTNLAWSGDSFVYTAVLDSGDTTVWSVKKYGSETLDVCSDEVVTNTGTYTCNFTTLGYINSPGEYVAVVRANAFTGNYTDVINVVSHFIQDTTKQAFLDDMREEGVVAMYVLTGTLAMGGAAISPAIGLLFLGIAFVGGTFMQLMNITYTTLVVLCFLLGWTIYKFRR